MKDIQITIVIRFDPQDLRQLSPAQQHALMVSITQLLAAARPTTTPAP